MTKKEFLKKIDGKKVVISNLNEIKEEAKKEIVNTLLFWEKHGILKDNKRLGFNFYYEIGSDENTTKIYIKGYKKDRSNSIILDSAFLHYNNRLRMYTNIKDKTIKVHSTFISLYWVRVEQKSLIINEKDYTFYTQYSECIYKVID